MSTKLVTLASLKLSNAGDSEKQALDCSANFDLSTSKTNNGITYSAKAAENTLTTGGFATKGVLGPVLEVSKAIGTRYGILTTTLGYDTGRKGFIAEAVNKYKKTEVEVEYSDITKAVVASGSVRANASNKFAASYNAAKRTAKGKHTFALSDFELVTVYDLAPARPPVFSATKVLPRGWGSAKATHSLANGATGLEHEYALPRVGGVLTSSYGVRDNAGSLAWEKGPCKLGIGTRWDGDRLTPPSLSLTVEQSYADLPLNPRNSSLPVVGRGAPSAKKGSGADAAAADPEVDAKLTRIDRAYQAELSRLTHQVGKPAHK